MPGRLWRSGAWQLIGLEGVRCQVNHYKPLFTSFELLGCLNFGKLASFDSAWLLAALIKMRLPADQPPTHDSTSLTSSNGPHSDH